jgi:hypothetical protein
MISLTGTDFPPWHDHLDCIINFSDWKDAVIRHDQNGLAEKAQALSFDKACAFSNPSDWS